MSGSGEIILYTGESGAQVQLRAVQGTVWLSQAQLAEFYGTSEPNIAQIIARVLADGEVTEATINSELVVRREGARQVRREIKIYNLDMILAVGYYQIAMANNDKANAKIAMVDALSKDETQLFREYSDNVDFKKWFEDAVFRATYKTSA